MLLISYFTTSCVYPFSSYCSYSWFYTVFLLIFVLAYLNGWSSAFMIYLSLLVAFFLFCRYSVLIIYFSFIFREDPLHFFNGGLILMDSLSFYFSAERLSPPYWGKGWVSSSWNRSSKDLVWAGFVSSTCVLCLLPEVSPLH